MDMQLSRSFNLHLIWKSLSLAVNLITTILIARLLGASLSGQFFYFLSWMSFLVLMASLSLDSSITYFTASKMIPRQQILTIAIIWILLVFIILAVVGNILGDKIRFIADLPANGFLLGLFFIAGQLMINYFTALYYGEKEFVLPAKILSFSGIVYVLFLIFCMMQDSSVVYYNLIISSYIYFILIQGLIIMSLVIFSKEVKLFSFSFDIRLLKDLFVYSSTAFAANILFFLVTRVDYWFLHYYNADGVSIGNYIQVSRIVQLFQILPSMIAAFLFPVVASNKEKILPHLTLLCRIIILLDLICVIILGFFGKYLFPFIFGVSFRQMHELFLLLMPGIFSLSLLAIFSAYFAGINKVKINMLGAIFGLISVSLLNYIFIPFYHVKAAAIVSSVGYTVCMMYALFYMKKNFNFSVKELFVIKSADISILKKLIANK